MKTLKSLFRQLFSDKIGYAVQLEDKQTVAGLIHLIVLITSLTGGLVMYFYELNSSLSLFLLSAASLVGWLVNRAGQPRTSAVILSFALLITIQYNIFVGFGIHDVAIIAWPALIFFFGLLLGWKIIPYITALIMGLAVVTNLIPHAQFIPGYSDTGDLIVMLLVLVAFSLIAISLLRSNEDLLQRSQRSEERFREIFNSINNAILICDSHTGAILNFNEKASEIFGDLRQDPALLATARTSAAGQPYTQEAALELIKKAAAQKEQQFEWQLSDKNGRLIWVAGNLKLASIDGQDRVLVSVQDITDRKRAEVAQHESHQLLEGTFASLREAVFIIDANTASITNCNPAAEEMFGYSLKEMLGRTTEFIHVNQAALDTFRKHLIEAVAEKGFLSLPEFKMKHRNGIVFPTEHTVLPLKDEHGIRIGWVSVVRDITERKRSEQAFRESEEKYRRLFDNASLGIFQSSPAGKVISVNPAFALMMGYASPEDAAQSIQNVATDLFADPNRRAEILRLVAKNPDLKIFENVYRRKDGSTFIGRLNLTPIRNSDGQLQRTEGIIEDITERKQAEAKILAALEEKETLLREVHHRVKNNLQAIIALMEMQSDLIADESTRQFLKELEGQARTMSLVYEQLYQSANLARIQMDSYLQQLTFYVLETFGEQRMLQFNLDVEPIELDVAQAMPCGLVVNELFTNILKHAFPSDYQGQPSVQIALQSDGETYRLSVADNGVGLPPGQDWQGSHSLGLYLVKLWVTHQMGGTLDVSTDSGTAYHITFPKTARGSV